MKQIIAICDIQGCGSKKLTSSKKIPVMFDHDQEDGKSKVYPYFEMVDIDICDKCFTEMTTKRILLYAYGAQGVNKYEL